MKTWIEMSRDIEHGGNEWGFTECIWAPTYKKGKGGNKSWLYWNNVNKVKSGDFIIHIRGKGKEAEIVGYSNAKTDGYRTEERPPIAGEWAYCNSFYRAILTDFLRFKNSINIYQMFIDKEIELKNYYEKKSKPKNLFFTIQSGRLQCLNGGYLSEVDGNLLEIILYGTEKFDDGTVPIDVSVSTSTILKQIKARVGHERFATNVKNNYNNQCCFPGCKIVDKEFLVASHIARWADNTEKRGDTSNGLCLCPIHDKAFEIGYFSLDDNLRVCVEKKIDHSQIFKEYISQFIGLPISKGHIEPDREALKEHRKRCNISEQDC
ncbi:hypothetical protein DW886_18965 [Enterocloster aldenensis]|uniref:HNH endonuclease n=1 Tax=Enterocloster aldenensis TaxID=358742 RepID=UPI000E4B0067|nr:hypothetical protein DW886_18965 [Enterocloster aldenensis]